MTTVESVVQELDLLVQEARFEPGFCAAVGSAVQNDSFSLRTFAAEIGRRFQRLERPEPGKVSLPRHYHLRCWFRYLHEFFLVFAPWGKQSCDLVAPWHPLCIATLSHPNLRLNKVVSAYAKELLRRDISFVALLLKALLMRNGSVPGGPARCLLRTLTAQPVLLSFLAPYLAPSVVEGEFNEAELATGQQEAMLLFLQLTGMEGFVAVRAVSTDMWPALLKALRSCQTSSFLIGLKVLLLILHSLRQESSADRQSSSSLKPTVSPRCSCPSSLQSSFQLSPRSFWTSSTPSPDVSTCALSDLPICLSQLSVLFEIWRRAHLALDVAEEQPSCHRRTLRSPQGTSLASTVPNNTGNIALGGAAAQIPRATAALKKHSPKFPPPNLEADRGRSPSPLSASSTSSSSRRHRDRSGTWSSGAPHAADLSDTSPVLSSTSQSSTPRMTPSVSPASVSSHLSPGPDECDLTQPAKGVGGLRLLPTGDSRATRADRIEPWGPAAPAGAIGLRDERGWLIRELALQLHDLAPWEFLTFLRAQNAAASKQAKTAAGKPLACEEGAKRKNGEVHGEVSGIPRESLSVLLSELGMHPGLLGGPRHAWHSQGPRLLQARTAAKELEALGKEEKSECEQDQRYREEKQGEGELPELEDDLLGVPLEEVSSSQLTALAQAIRAELQARQPTRQPHSDAERRAYGWQGSVGSGGSEGLCSEVVSFHKDLERTVEHIRRHNAQAQKDVVRAKVREDKLLMEISQLKEANLEHQRQVVELCAELRAARACMAGLDEQREKAGQAARYTRQLERKLTAQMRLAAEQKTTCKELQQQLRQTARAQKAELATLSSELSTRDGQVQSLRAELRSYEDEIARLKGQRSLEAEERTQCSQLRQQLDSTESLTELLSRQAASSSAQYEQLRRKYLAVKQANAKLEAELVAYRAAVVKSHISSSELPSPSSSTAAITAPLPHLASSTPSSPPAVCDSSHSSAFPSINFSSPVSSYLSSSSSFPFSSSSSSFHSLPSEESAGDAIFTEQNYNSSWRKARRVPPSKPIIKRKGKRTPTNQSELPCT